MIFRIKNKMRGPVQLAVKTRDERGTQLMVLPWKASFDIPEERMSPQIEGLEKKGIITITKVYKK